MKPEAYVGSEAVARKIREWQAALIDLTRRNPLLSLPASGKSVLRIARTPDDLFRLFANGSRRKTLVFVPATLPFSTEPRPLKAGQLGAGDADLKLLNTLRLKARLSLTEQGVNVLFLALGVLEWPDPKSGALLRSPLLLVPAALERLPGDDGFKLSRFEDEVRVNPTLRHRLAQSDVRFALPEAEDEEDLTPSAFLSAVENAAASRPGWRVHTDECLLGRFSYLKLVMYEDLSAQAEIARGNPLVGALAGDPSAQAPLPAVAVPDVRALDTSGTPGENLHILDADPSQERAVLAARMGQSFVLQGPPGTGKTQTITNIIAACIADGKRVLFVSEKMAALDAVYKRLREHGLSGLCLEAHSHKANKKEVLEQLGRALNATARNSPAPEDGSRSAAFLGTIREELNATVRELHASRAPLGLSVYAVNGIVAASDAPDLPFVFTDAETVSADVYPRLESLAERLAAYHDLFEQAETHPWRGVRADRFTLDLQTRVRAAFSDLVLMADALEAQSVGLARACGLDWEDDIGSEHTERLLLLAVLLEKTPRPPAAWLSPGDSSLDALRDLAAACRARYHAFAHDRQTLLAVYAEAVFTLSHVDLAERLTRRHEDRLRSALGPNWSGMTPSTFAALSVALERVGERAERLRHGLRALAALCGLNTEETLAFARHAHGIAVAALADPGPQPGWLDPGAIPALVRQAEEAQAHWEALAQNRGELLAAYTEQILTLDLPTLRERFAADYASVFRWLKPAFHRDRRQIAGVLRPGVRIKDRDLSRDLAQAQAINTHAAWLRENREVLVAAFGGVHYREAETDWIALRAALGQTEGLAALFPGGRVPEALARRLVASGPEMQALRDQHALFARHLAEVEMELGDGGELTTLAVLPQAEAVPVAQLPLGGVMEWCRAVRESAGDFHAARQVLLALRRVNPFDARSENTPPVSAEHLAADLAEAKRLVEEDAAITGQSDALRQHYAGFYDGLATNWDAVLEALAWTDALRKRFNGQILPAPLVRIVVEGSPSVRAEIAARRKDLAARRDAAAPLWTELSALFPPERLQIEDTGESLPSASYEAITTWAGVRLARIGDLERWIGFQNLRDACADVGMLSFFEVVAHRRPPADQVLAAFRKGFHRRWLDAVTDAVPLLRQFRGDDHDKRRARFADLDRAQIVHAPARVRAQMWAKHPKANGPLFDVGEIGVLKKQLAVKKKWAIRKLLSAIPNLLFKLTPCLMMSPLSVSLFLDADKIHFDLVVFDEASQIFTEAAVGALLRAKQVVIAGDTRQLPPTSFFVGLKDDGDEDGEENSDDAPAASSANEFESVLAAAGPCFAEHPLNWHYRSRHESLIAFSRRHFYPHMITFPSSWRGSAVRFVHVPDGVYYGGKGEPRNNAVEAARVADLVETHVREHPRQSIGVIAMSEAQQTTIQNEIDRRKAADPELSARLSEEGPEGFFVKNIETVQGDERDAVFFSIGYGRSRSGVLNRGFGPISNEGGERRLNVAVTRARAGVTVVCSFLPSELDVSNAKYEGPKLLRAYLEYALTGVLAEDTAQSVPPPADFEEAVRDSLARRGHLVQSLVGTSGYRVDLGVIDPENPDRYVLGIECDGPMYDGPGAETARGRERLRGEVLRKLDWRLHRVWSVDWVRDRENVLFGIEQALKRARTGDPLDETTEPEAMAALPMEQAQSAENPSSAGSVAAETHSNPGTPGGLPPGITPFTRADLPLPGGPAALYGDERARENFLHRLVELEGPILFLVAAQRLTAAAGLERTGAQLQRLARQTVDTLIAAGKIETRGDDFLWPVGLPEAPARVPRPGDMARPIEEISREEIGEILVALIRAGVGMRRDEAISETARLLGFNRTGANVSTRISEALSALELDNRVHIRGGQVYTFDAPNEP